MSIQQRFWQKLTQIGKSFIDFIAKFIEFSWNLPIIISGGLSILSFIVFFYGLYEIVHGFYKISQSVQEEMIQTELLLCVIWTLKDFLLAFVLFLLSVGIYDKIDFYSDPANSKVNKEIEFVGIEKNFIGIIILTMLVVILGKILPSTGNILEIFIMSISIATIMIAAAIYIKFSSNVSPVETENVETENVEN